MSVFLVIVEFRLKCIYLFKCYILICLINHSFSSAHNFFFIEFIDMNLKLSLIKPNPTDTFADKLILLLLFNF